MAAALIAGVLLSAGVSTWSAVRVYRFLIRRLRPAAEVAAAPAAAEVPVALPAAAAGEAPVAAAV